MSDLSVRILSDLVIFNKYAKFLDEVGRRETWEEICLRNQNMHIRKYPHLNKEIREVYRNFVIPKKVLPSMRSLQFGGRAIEMNEARIYNCCYLPIDSIEAFQETMFLLLSGTGVGYSVQRRHVKNLPSIKTPLQFQKHMVQDSIVGWSDAVSHLFYSYMSNSPRPVFDFRDIRPKGTPLKTSGGRAPGPDKLRESLERCGAILISATGRQLTTLEVHDCLCILADAVISGGIRRAAMISIFSNDDQVMAECKSGEWWTTHPERGRSNNSAVFLRSDDNYFEFDRIFEAARASNAGEPGILWTDDLDWGVNPCVTGDTLVAVADGRNAVPIKDLVGTLYPVYAIENGKTVIKQSLKTWKTRENAEIWKLILDDGSTLRATPDHLIMLRNGEYIPLKDLKAGDSLMPFNSFISNERYRQISSNVGRDRRQYRMIAEHGGIIVDAKTTAIHHADFNSTNDSLDNLIAMPHADHIALHRVGMLGSSNAVFRIKDKNAWKSKLSDAGSGLKNPNSSELTNEDIYNMAIRLTESIGRCANGGDWEIFAANIGAPIFFSKFRKDALGTIVSMLKRAAIELGYEPEAKRSIRKPQPTDSLYNHKVVSIEFCGYEDVYDMTVEDVHNFGIITSTKDDKAITSSGIFIHNCAEIALQPFQFCNLCEINATDIDSQEELEARTEAAAFLGTLQAGYSDFYYLRPIWRETTQKEALLGVSMTGIASGAVLKLDLKAAAEIAVKTNQIISSIIGINSAARVTTIKPAGTTSLVLGSSSGIHGWWSPFYIRRMEVNKIEPIYAYLAKNFPDLIEDDFFKPDVQAKISIPVRAPEGAIYREEDALTFLDRILLLSREWIAPGHVSGINRHNVSATVNVRKDEWDIVKAWMWNNRQSYMGLSLLPFDDHTYVQAPHEPISESTYKRMLESLVEIDLTKVDEKHDLTNLTDELACFGGGSCELK